MTMSRTWIQIAVICTMIRLCTAIPDFLSWFKGITFIWTVKEVTMHDTLSSYREIISNFISGKWMIGIEFLNNMIFDRYPGTWSIISYIAMIYCTYEIISFIKGRHRTPHQSMDKTSTQTTTSNVFNLHSAMQLGGKTRDDHYNKAEAQPYIKYTSEMDLTAWFKKLELLFKLNKVNPKEWPDLTIMLLSGEQDLKIGEYEQYSQGPEGFEKLKDALKNNPFTAKQTNTSSDINALANRRQLLGETADTFGTALKTLGQDLLKDDMKLKDLFCAGLNSEKIREKTAEQIFQNKSDSFEKLIEKATKEELKQKEIINYLRNNSTSSDTAYDSPGYDKTHYKKKR